MPAGFSDEDLYVEELEGIVASQAKRLANVEKLMAEWMGYCHMGAQTGRIIEEVRDVLAGKPVMAGTTWIQ